MFKFSVYKFFFLIFSLVIYFDNANAVALPNEISSMVEESAPAVVNITSKREVKMRNNDFFEEFERRFGIPRGFPPTPQQPQTREAVAYGSGFIFKDQYLLTNFHVVEDANEIIVSLSDRREFIAEVIGVDPLSDLAVLKIDGKKLPKVKIGKTK